MVPRCKETPPQLRCVGRTLPAIELLTGVNKTGSCGRRGKESTPEERKFKWFRGELRSQREGKHPGRRKRQVVPGRRGKESTPEEGKGKWFRGARKRPFAYAQRQVVGDIRVVDWRQQSPLPQGSAPSHTLSGKSSGTLELLTGVNKVPSSKRVNLP